MTVTFTVPPPGNTIGLGAPFNVLSDVGSWVQPMEWIINVYQDAARLNQAFQNIITGAAQSESINLGFQSPTIIFTQASGGVMLEDSTAYIRAVAFQPGGLGVVDSGNFTFNWTSVPWLPIWLEQHPSVGGGLTGGQAAQLTDIQNTAHTTQDAVTIPIGTPAVATPLSTLLTPTISSDLLLVEITSGPTGLFVGATLGAFLNAIIIRLVSLPPGLTPLTPDGDYFLPTLATVRIYHGSDLYLRVPIHTTSKIIELQPSFWGTAVAAIQQAIWPNAVTLQVEWLAGVTGQVFKSILP